VLVVETGVVVVVVVVGTGPGRHVEKVRLALIVGAALTGPMVVVVVVVVGAAASVVVVGVVPEASATPGAMAAVVVTTANASSDFAIPALRRGRRAGRTTREATLRRGTRDRWTGVR